MKAPNLPNHLCRRSVLRKTDCRMMLLKLVRPCASPSTRASLVRTSNHSRACASPLVQKLVAASFRSVSSQQSSCLSAASKMAEMSACGDDSDDTNNPRTAATCASDACVGFVASVTDDALQNMSTGAASCTGVYAEYQAYTADYLRMIVLNTASTCNLTSTLTPLSLDTCAGAMSKMAEKSACGDDSDDDNPRTAATCASDACVGVSSQA